MVLKGINTLDSISLKFVMVLEEGKVISDTINTPDSISLKFVMVLV